MKGAPSTSLTAGLLVLAVLLALASVAVAVQIQPVPAPTPAVKADDPIALTRGDLAKLICEAASDPNSVVWTYDFDKATLRGSWATPEGVPAAQKGFFYSVALKQQTRLLALIQQHIDPRATAGYVQLTRTPPK